MAFRGRGRGRGGFGGQGFRRTKQVPFELFPDIDDLDKAESSPTNSSLIKWSCTFTKLQETCPYKYEGDKRTKGATLKAKPTFWDYMMLDADHVPAELSRKGKKLHVPKRVEWKPKSDFNEIDHVFEKLANKEESEKEDDSKDDGENSSSDEEDDENDDGEESDRHNDYTQAVYFDDDEDDFNMPEDDDDYEGVF